MAFYESCLNIDKPAYSSATLALQTLDPQLLECVSSLERVFRQQLLCLQDNQTVCVDQPNTVFMGIMRWKPMQERTNLLSFRLDECFENGTLTGDSFILTLDQKLSMEWINHPTIECMSKGEWLLVIFQNLPAIISRVKEIQFITTRLTADATVLVKHYRSDFYVGLSTSITNLSEAAAIKANKFDGFAVVRSVIKKPECTKRGTGHGIYAIYDPSCFDSNLTTKFKDFIVQIFSKSSITFPVINSGDIIKFIKIGTQKRLNKNEEIEFIVSSDRDHQFIVFPNGNQLETPQCPDPYYKVSEEDFKTVNELKQWAQDLDNSTFISNLHSTKKRHEALPSIDITPKRYEKGLPHRKVSNYFQANNVNANASSPTQNGSVIDKASHNSSKQDENSLGREFNDQLKTLNYLYSRSNPELRKVVCSTLNDLLESTKIAILNNVQSQPAKALSFSNLTPRKLKTVSNLNSASSDSQPGPLKKPRKETEMASEDSRISGVAILEAQESERFETSITEEDTLQLPNAMSFYGKRFMNIFSSTPK